MLTRSFPRILVWLARASFDVPRLSIRFDSVTVRSRFRGVLVGFVTAFVTTNAYARCENALSNRFRNYLRVHPIENYENHDSCFTNFRSFNLVLSTLRTCWTSTKERKVRGSEKGQRRDCRERKDESIIYSSNMATAIDDRQELLEQFQAVSPFVLRSRPFVLQSRVWYLERSTPNNNYVCFPF